MLPILRGCGQRAVLGLRCLRHHRTFLGANKFKILIICWARLIINLNYRLESSDQVHWMGQEWSNTVDFHKRQMVYPSMFPSFLQKQCARGSELCLPGIPNILKQNKMHTMRFIKLIYLYSRNYQKLTTLKVQKINCNLTDLT